MILYFSAVASLVILFLATYNPFNVGEQWTGTYNTTSNGAAVNGAITLEVISISGLTVQIFGTFTHGTYCNVAAGCRTPGVTQYYLNGQVNGQQLVATPAGYSGITDTTFAQLGLSGFINVVGAVTKLAGNFGTGTFQTTLACSAAVG